MAEALFLPRDQFLRLGAERPEILLRMLATLSVRLRKFVGRIESLASRPAPARLAARLLELAWEALEDGGLPLGAFDFGNYSEGEIVLDEGDLLLLYTDGLTEIHTNNNKGYGVLQSGGASAVYDPQVLPRPLTIRCVPNPFNPLTNFDFRIPRSGRTTLSIYDVTGRLVTRLVDEYLERGDHTRTWSGTDSNGRRLASGMYLYRIESGGYANTGKVIIEA